MEKTMKKKETPAPVLDEKGRPPLKLNYPQTFKVGFAFAIIMLFWTAYDFVVPLLLEQAYGLPSWARGIIMGLDNLLSLFMLPLFGKLSDNAKGKLVKKWGRRTPFIVIGTVCAVVLMVFVPVVTLRQAEKADKLTTSIEAKLDSNEFMEPLLTEWYDNAVAGKEGSANYCDLTYLNQKGNNVSREEFISLRYYSKMTSKKAVLNMIGNTTYYYDANGDGKFTDDEIVTDLSAQSPVEGKTYQNLLDSNASYKKYVAAGMNNYISNEIHEKCTKTAEGVKSLVVYMVILLLVLIAMATFRSPAVALMPDVTPKPLRSQANAIINLCGGVGGAIAFLIYTVVLFGQRLENYVIIFGSVAGGMLLLLAGFLALVNERKMVAKCQEICKEYEIDDFAEGENPDAERFAEELISEGDAEYNLDSKPSGDAQQLLDTGAKAENKEQIAPETLEFAQQVVENTKKNVKLPKSGGAQRANSKEADSNPSLSFSLRSLCGLWATTLYLPTCPSTPPRHSTFRQV